MSFASKFAAGMQIADDLMETYDTASMGAAMKEAKDAKPETTQEFSTEDAGKIDSAAQGGQDVTWSEQTGGYLAQPKEGGPPEIFQPKEHTSFLGQKSIGKMSDDQVVQARTGHLESKAAGLFNPARGLKMLNEFKTAEREDFKWGLLKTKAAQEAEAFKKEEAASAAEQAAWTSTPSGQGVAKYAADMDAWQKDKEKREAAVKAGQPVDGPELPQPTMPAVSPVQTMADTLRAMSARAGAGGKVDVASLAKMSLALDTATKEGYTAALRAGQEGMPIEQVAKLFNASGAARFDAANVTADEVVKRPDGTTTRIIKYTDPATGKTQTIDTMATLGGLGQANDYYKRVVDGLDAQGKRLLRDSQIARNNAQAGLAATRATGSVSASAGSRTAQTVPPGATAAQSTLDVAQEMVVKQYGKQGGAANQLTPQAMAQVRSSVDALYKLNPKATPNDLVLAAMQQQDGSLAATGVRIDPYTGSIVRFAPSASDPGKGMNVGVVDFASLDKDGRAQVQSSLDKQAQALGVSWKNLRDAARDPQQASQLRAMLRDQGKAAALRQVQAVEQKTGRKVPDSQLEAALSEGERRLDAMLGIARQVYSAQ